MNEWVLAPLGLLALCAAWVLFVNRRPRVGGVVWPEGMTLTGPVTCPDLAYDGTVVLGANVELGVIRCRTLVVARGVEVGARRVEAGRVRVEGTLLVDEVLAAAKLVDIAGELEADEVQAPRIRLRKRARATVVVVPGKPRLVRHPAAHVKGFFSSRSELPAAGVPLRHRMDTQKIRLVEG